MYLKIMFHTKIAIIIKPPHLCILTFLNAVKDYYSNYPDDYCLKNIFMLSRYVTEQPVSLSATVDS